MPDFLQYQNNMTTMVLICEIAIWHTRMGLFEESLPQPGASVHQPPWLPELCPGMVAGVAGAVAKARRASLTVMAGPWFPSS